MKEAARPHATSEKRRVKPFMPILVRQNILMNISINCAFLQDNMIAAARLHASSENQRVNPFLSRDLLRKCCLHALKLFGNYQGLKPKIQNI